MADKRVVPEPLVYEHQGNSTAFRPQAAPVDRFIKPTEPIKSTMWDVAQSIAEVNPKITAYLKDWADEGAAADKKKAEADAMVADAKTYQEAIDKGQISPGQSPLYQRVFQETIGKNEALSTASATLQKAWYANDNPIRNSQNPQEINAWLNQQTQAMLKDKNPDWVKGFIPQLTAVKQQLVQKWVGESVQNIEEENKNQYGTLVMNRIASMRGQSPAAIADALANDTIPQQFAGLKRSDINKLQAQALIDYATKTGDTSVLRVGYEKRPDIKKPGEYIDGVFNIPGFAQRAQAAETAILSKAHVQESRALTQETRANQAELTRLVGIEAINARNNPDYRTPDEVFNKIAMLPHGTTTLSATIAATNKPQVPFDPVKFSPIAQRLAEVTAPGSGASHGEMLRAVQDAIPYAQSQQQVINLYSLIQKSDGKEPGIFRSMVFQSAVQGVDRLQDALIHKLEPVAAGMAARELKEKAYAFTLQYVMQNGKNGEVADMADFQKQLSAFMKQGIDDMNAKLNASSLPPAPSTNKGGARGPAPGAPAAPSAPTPAAPAAPTAPTNAAPLNQQGSAVAPAAPTAASVEVPTDRLVATNDSLGRFSGDTFTLKTGAGLDLKSINTLRSDPTKDVNGKPLWKVFDENFGDGASQFLLSANEGQIKYAIKRAGFSTQKSTPPAATKPEGPRSAGPNPRQQTAPVPVQDEGWIKSTADWLNSTDNSRK